MSDTINIFSVTDDNFAPYTGIMLTSVFENNKNHSFDVYILVGKPLKKRITDQFCDLERKYHQKINFIVVDDTIIRRYNLVDKWSIATYYKLLAGELLPSTISKVLYLDGDIVVTGDLQQFWNVDINGQALAVVPNIRFDDCAKRFHYPAEAGCFSTGVMLMNLDYLRNDKTSQRFMDFIENNSEKIVVGDQDVFNAVLWDEKRFLPLTYNYQILFLSKDIFNSKSSDIQKEILETYKSPRIIHYSYINKPWSVVYYGCPFLKEWKVYKKLSPWSYLLPTVPKKKALNWLIKRYILWPLGIMKNEMGFISVK